MAQILQAKFRRLIHLIYQAYQMLGYNTTQRGSSLQSFGLDPVDWDELTNLPIIVEVSKMLISEWGENREEFSDLLNSFKPVLNYAMLNPNFDIKRFSGKDYLSISNLPHDFYKSLQNQINWAYSAGILPAVRILSRKFLENLIVDILRKKFGFEPGNLELFFDKKHNRHQPFWWLLEKLESKLGEFVGFPTAFDSDLIRKIEKYKGGANASAHTLELNLTQGMVDNDAEDLDFIIKVLIRVLDAL